MWSLLDMLWSLRQGNNQIWGCIMSPAYTDLLLCSQAPSPRPSIGRWNLHDNDHLIMRLPWLGDSASSNYYSSVCGVYISLCIINCTMDSTHNLCIFCKFTHGGIKYTYVLTATLLGLHTITSHISGLPTLTFTVALRGEWEGAKGG